jgi:hypothetical protein
MFTSCKTHSPLLGKLIEADFISANTCSKVVIVDWNTTSAIVGGHIASVLMEAGLKNYILKQNWTFEIYR